MSKSAVREHRGDTMNQVLSNSSKTIQSIVLNE